MNDIDRGTNDEAKIAEDENEARADELEQPTEEPESRLQRFARLSVRWLAGLLIVFALGVLATVFVLLQPARQDLSQTRAELEQANQRITELEAEVERLSTFERSNQKLSEDLDTANLHITILRALSDVNAARLALAMDDSASAQVHLTKTNQTLQELEGLVDANSRDLVVSMQDRLELALSEIGEDNFAAQSDLGVLSTNLVQIENTYFTSQ